MSVAASGAASGIADLLMELQFHNNQSSALEEGFASGAIAGLGELRVLGDLGVIAVAIRRAEPMLKSDALNELSAYPRHAVREELLKSEEPVCAE